MRGRGYITRARKGNQIFRIGILLGRGIQPGLIKVTIKREIQLHYSHIQRNLAFTANPPYFRASILFPLSPRMLLLLAQRLVQK